MNTEDETDSRRFARDAFPESAPDHLIEIEQKAMALLRFQRLLGKAIILMGGLMAATAVIFFICNSFNAN